MRHGFLTPISLRRRDAIGTIVADLLDQTRIAFERLAAHNFDAPWRDEAPCRCL